tara:strand:+ start:1562 stop:2632 length:1071 start_codon:yes stop_codon:yes gene_type:complete
MNDVEKKSTDNNIKAVVVKKKRGRKPKPKKDEVKKIPKKRGRKPKPKVNNGEKKNKKRGRKPKNKYGIVPKKIIEPMDVENNNIILHLPISSTQINESINLYSDKKETVEPSEYNNVPFFVIDNSLDEQSIDEQPNIAKRDIKDIINERNEEIGTYKVDNCIHHTLLPFYEANKNKKWPTSTSISCFWCTEPFDGCPISLPIKYVNNTFHVDGCFCSVECAAAYNFEHTDSTLVWERNSLLNLLYIKMFNDVKIGIKPAPPRRSLKKFGGILTIKEFRKFNNNYYKQYRIVMPPMISVLPDLEKTDLNSNLRRKYNYIPIDNERIKNVNERLVLKRNKPINKYKNTLENCMSLKIV